MIDQSEHPGTREDVVAALEIAYKDPCPRCRALAIARLYTSYAAERYPEECATAAKPAEDP